MDFPEHRLCCRVGGEKVGRERKKMKNEKEKRKRTAENAG